MKKTMILFIVMVFGALELFAQEAGGSVYGGNRRRTTGVLTGVLATADPKDAIQTQYLDANVLLNLKPEGFVAVFGLSDEGASVPDGQTRLDGRIRGFLAALKELGIQDGDLFVDYISQNRVYDYALTGNTAREKLTGFEVKKNIAIRYQDRALLDKMLAAAARFSIFDLVKVDYLTAKPFEVRHRLMEAASRVISQKKDDYAAFFGIKLRPSTVFQEKFNVFLPAEQYNSYTAYDAGSVSGDNDVRVVEKRKTSTFYYNPLHPGEFDLIIDPVVTEPVIQYSLYLKIACRPEP